jgi:hypothetical protein
MAIRDLKSVVYTDDGGRQYSTKIDASVFAQTGGSGPKVGGADYTGSPELAPLPRNFRPRTVTVSAAGNKRRVVCLTAASTLYVGTDTNIDLPVLGAAAVTYTRVRRTAETYRTSHDPSQ